MIFLFIVAIVIWSFRRDLWVIRYLLFLQAIQMQMSNLNIYEPGSNANESDGFTNYQGLNMLSTVYSVIFSISNSILMGFVFPNKDI